MKRKRKVRIKKIVFIILIILLLLAGTIAYKTLFSSNEKNDTDKLETVVDDALTREFKSLGYSSKEIKYVKELSKKNIDKLRNIEHIDISNYYKYKNFNVDNYSRYESYKEKNNSSYDKTITYVNIGLDKEFYTGSSEVTDTDNLLIIINKYYYLNKDYVPKNLVTLFDSKNNAKMVDVAASAYKELVADALVDNITLESTTAYRSYGFQNILYTNYVKEDGQELADTYSARPGYSEHQTGLAVDLNDPNVHGKRLDEKDTLWLDENAYKYGFIRRYKEEFIPITGYMNEEWHIRYVGKDVATIIHNENITLEEYIDLYVMQY